MECEKDDHEAESSLSEKDCRKDFTSITRVVDIQDAHKWLDAVDLNSQASYIWNGENTENQTGGERHEKGVLFQPWFGDAGNSGILMATLTAQLREKCTEVHFVLWAWSHAEERWLEEKRLLETRLAAIHSSLALREESLVKECNVAREDAKKAGETLEHTRAAFQAERNSLMERLHALESECRGCVGERTMCHVNHEWPSKRGVNSGSTNTTRAGGSAFTEDVVSTVDELRKELQTMAEENARLLRRCITLEQSVPSTYRMERCVSAPPAEVSCVFEEEDNLFGSPPFETPKPILRANASSAPSSHQKAHDDLMATSPRYRELSAQVEALKETCENLEGKLVEQYTIRNQLELKCLRLVERLEAQTSGGPKITRSEAVQTTSVPVEVPRLKVCIGVSKIESFPNRLGRLPSARSVGTQCSASLHLLPERVESSDMRVSHARESGQPRLAPNLPSLKVSTLRRRQLSFDGGGLLLRRYALLSQSRTGHEEEVTAEKAGRDCGSPVTQLSPPAHRQSEEGILPARSCSTSPVKPSPIVLPLKKDYDTIFRSDVGSRWPTLKAPTKQAPPLASTWGHPKRRASHDTSQGLDPLSGQLPFTAPRLRGSRAYQDADRQQTVHPPLMPVDLQRRFPFNMKTRVAQPQECRMQGNALNDQQRLGEGKQWGAQFPASRSVPPLPLLKKTQPPLYYHSTETQKMYGARREASWPYLKPVYRGEQVTDIKSQESLRSCPTAASQQHVAFSPAGQKRPKSVLRYALNTLQLDAFQELRNSDRRA